MDKNPGAKLFWRMTGPLFLYWLINFAVRFVCELMLVFPHVAEIISGAFPSGMTGKADAAKLALLLSQKLTEILMPHQILILTAGALGTVPLTLYLFLKDRKTDLVPDFSANKKAEPLKYLQVTGFGVAVCIGLNCLLFMAGLAFFGGEYRQTFQVVYSAGILKEIICLGILIPFSEELMFRGILFRRFRKIAGFARAALLTSFLFAFFHVDALQMIYALTVGLFLAYVYEKFGSLKAPALLHVVLNVTSIILTEAKGFDYLASNILIMGFVTVLCAFFGSLMFVSIQRIDLKPDLSEHTEIK